MHRRDAIAIPYGMAWETNTSMLSVDNGRGTIALKKFAVTW